LKIPIFGEKVFLAGGQSFSGTLAFKSDARDIAQVDEVLGPSFLASRKTEKSPLERFLDPYDTWLGVGDFRVEPPLTGNIANRAALNPGSAGAAVDGSLTTEWLGGHKFTPG